MPGLHRFFKTRTVHSLFIEIFLAVMIPVSFSLFSTDAIAHGGVSIEDDLCIMSIGNMRAHFTGYQPKVRASQEFCEDIPELGEAIIVLDFLSPALRKMDVTFQVMKDDAGKGPNTSFSDVEPRLMNARDLIVNKEAATYPSGSFNVSLSIQEAGWYVGVVSAVDPDTNEEVVSVFPFSVGQRDYLGIVLWCVAIVTIALSFYFLSVGLNRRTQPQHE